MAKVPTYENDGMDKVIQWVEKRNRQGQTEFAQSGGRREPSPDRWSQEVVYQIMVDRFNDGDPSNNSANIEDFQKQFQGTSQLKVDEFRHGGDLRGIIQRLDYLSDLGITSLWVTPILKSQGSYHGYCLQDPTQVDPGFGSTSDLRELTREAHKRGIKVILDIVVNHLCDPGTKYAGAEYLSETCVKEFDKKQYLGHPVNPQAQRTLVFSSQFFGPLKSPHFFSRCGYQPGAFALSGAAAVWGDFSSSMLDFDTTNWDFQRIFTDLHKYWIASTDVDGFRLDAAKHVTQDFVAYFSTNIRAYASSLGKKNFFIVGEVADAPDYMAGYVGKMKAEVNNPGSSTRITPALKQRLIELQATYQSQYFPFPGLNSVYDFAHSGATVDVFKYNKSPRNLKNWFWAGGETDNIDASGDFAQLAFNGDTRMNWNLLEIHDWPRFLLEISNPAKAFPALAYLMTTQGVPILYYGIEQGLNGQCNGIASSLREAQAKNHVNDICHSSDFHNHTRYRQDMFMSGPWKLGSIVPEIQRLGFIGTSPAAATAGDPYANQSHELYRYVRQLAHLRQSCKSLGDGAIYFRAAHTDPGLLAFARILDDQETVVMVNSSDKEIEMSQVVIDSSINGGRIGRRYRNIFFDAQSGVIERAADGGLRLRLNESGRFALKPFSAAIFVYEDQMRRDAGRNQWLCR